MNAPVRPRNRFAQPRTASDVLPGVILLGTRRVNFYAVTEGRAITLIDCGFDGHWRYLHQWLDVSGHTLGDIEAVVLTHGHADHVGFAQRLGNQGIPVHLHADDAAFASSAKGRRPPQRLRRNLWRPSVLQLLGEATLDGVFSQEPLRDPHTFTDGMVLDVPGRLEVIAVPGHSAGSVALHHRATETLFTGDALMTRDPMLGHEGPLVFAEHTRRTPMALEALRRLEPYGDTALLPAHGEPLTTHGSTRDAITQARAV